MQHQYIERGNDCAYVSSIVMGTFI